MARTLKGGRKHWTHALIRRPAIRALNVALLAVLLVGVPAVTGVSLGVFRISSPDWLGRLLLGGLALGVLANGLLGWGTRHRQERAILLGWMFLHAALLLVVLLAHFGWIEFGWLREWLDRAAKWGTRG
ncbi:MAG: hypothetical protein KJ072_25080 [Verrucomicrobia bacterium]|nr:hypothetical protein [Verrucomicrobiota bacterium]